MSFFEPPPEEPVPPPEFAEEPLGAYLPGVVPVEADLARSRRAVIALRELLVFPDGIEFALVTHLSPEAARERDEYLGEQMSLLHRRQAARRETASVMVMRTAPREHPDARRPRRLMVPPLFGFGPFNDMGDFRFGVQLGDGSKVTSLQPILPADADSEPTMALERVNTHGGDGRLEQHVFLWPLPQQEITVVVEWQTQEIAETRYTLDSAGIAAAAERCRPAWPEDAGRVSHRRVSLDIYRMSRAGEDDELSPTQG